MRASGFVMGVGAVSLLIALGGGDAAAIDGVQYNPTTKHWYKLYLEKVSWHTAKGKAATLGGYLVSVTSAAEEQWIWSNLASAPGSWALWLGATDEVSEGVWKWVSGEPWSYANWGSGEPGNVNGIEHYLVLRDDGLWGDRDATGSLGVRPIDRYIVEWNEDPNGGPPPPPPPTSLPDLVATALSLTPPNPGPGDTIRLAFTARNAGDPSGPIVARLGLAGHDGPVLAERTLAALARGQAISSDLTARLPDDLPSGEYRATVLLDASGARDANPGDNVGTYARAFRIERGAMALVPGLERKGALGPLGRQAFTLDAFPALSAKLAVKLKGGFGVKTLLREDGTVVAEATDKGKLKATIEGEEGVLVVVVESEMDRGTSYEVSLEARWIGESGEVEVGAEAVALSIPGFSGMTAKVTLRGLDGLVPALDAGDLGEGASVKVSGTKVKAKGLALEGDGPWVVLVSGGGGTRGRCAWSVQVK